MRITLTGATGFIGTRLVNRLLAERHELTILTRSPKPGTSPRYLVWNPMRQAPQVAAFDGCGAVIHLAGEPVAQRWTAQVKEQIRASRVEGTRRLVETLAGLEKKPAVLISASAIGIYGSRGDEVLEEASAAGVGFLADVTRQWEEAAAAVEPLGIRSVQVRIGVVLGNGGALGKMLPPFRAGVGGPLAGGRQWMSWIHVDDLVEMIVFALKNDSVRGPVNGTSPNPVTNQEFTRQLGEALKRPAVVPAPGFALKLLFGEMASVMLASQNVIPRVAINAGFTFRYPELRAAIEQILGSTTKARTAEESGPGQSRN